jgi:hypothetical protein
MVTLFNVTRQPRHILHVSRVVKGITIYLDLQMSDYRLRIRLVLTRLDCKTNCIHPDMQRHRSGNLFARASALFCASIGPRLTARMHTNNDDTTAIQAGYIRNWTLRNEKKALSLLQEMVGEGAFEIRSGLCDLYEAETLFVVPALFGYVYHMSAYPSWDSIPT